MVIKQDHDRRREREAAEEDLVVAEELSIASQADTQEHLAVAEVIMTMALVIIDYHDQEPVAMATVKRSGVASLAGD